MCGIAKADLSVQQAEATLILLMEKQLAVRKEQTAALRAFVRFVLPFQGEVLMCDVGTVNVIPLRVISKP